MLSVRLFKDAILHLFIVSSGCLRSLCLAFLTPDIGKAFFLHTTAADWIVLFLLGQFPMDPADGHCA